MHLRCDGVDGELHQRLNDALRRRRVVLVLQTASHVTLSTPSFVAHEFVLIGEAWYFVEDNEKCVEPRSTVVRFEEPNTVVGRL